MSGLDPRIRQLALGFVLDDGGLDDFCFFTFEPAMTMRRVKRSRIQKSTKKVSDLSIGTMKI
jgi:hypothetical protein